MLRGCLASIADSIDATRVPYEVLVVFQQTVRRGVESFLSDINGVRPLFARVNLGFGGGNNYAARYAQGKYLVFLNDDTVTQRGWLEALVAVAERDEMIGAVASRILFLDGRLQEAGAIVWSDGSCYPLGRGQAIGSLAYTYARDVEHASANGMLMQRSAFERARGFDDQFFPAYYEDVDLCLTLRHRLGARVVYEPRSVIYHYESATANRDPDFRSFLFERHRRLFCKKWERELAYYPAAEPESALAVERAVLRARGNPARILVLDDRVPHIGLGSGFGRTQDMLNELSAAGYAIDFVPTNHRYAPPENALGHLGIDIVEEPLWDHLARPEKRYDLVIISRPHNFSAYYRAIRGAMPHTPVIYDAEALYHRRLFLQARLDLDSARLDGLLKQAEDMQDEEIEIVRSADLVVAISDTEVDWLKSVNQHAPVTFMRPLASNIQMQPMNLVQRVGAVFVAGWLAGEQSPNVGALQWYAKYVLPLIREALPGFVTYVSGANPPLSVQCLESRDLALMGFVESIESLYLSARVAIAPLLAGAGVKIKTIEAMQYGLPVVATSVGAEGLALADQVDIDIADDPKEFAARVIAIATDDDLWRRRRARIEKTIALWESERVDWSEVASKILQKHEASHPLTLC